MRLKMVKDVWSIYDQTNEIPKDSNALDRFFCKVKLVWFALGYLESFDGSWGIDHRHSIRFPRDYADGMLSFIWTVWIKYGYHTSRVRKFLIISDDSNAEKVLEKFCDYMKTVLGKEVNMEIMISPHHREKYEYSIYDQEYLEKQEEIDS